MVSVITAGVISSFKCNNTKILAHGIHVARFADFERSARRKLAQLEIADHLDDLQIPPGNCLEAHPDSSFGNQSIRINDQWRVCFRWSGAVADDVEIEQWGRSKSTTWRVRTSG